MAQVARRRGVASIRKTTRAGLAYSPRRLRTIEHRMWRDFLQYAIAGITSAHRRTPNAEMVVRLAAKIADQAIEECRRRRNGKAATIGFLFLSSCL